MASLLHLGSPGPSLHQMPTTAAIAGTEDLSELPGLRERVRGYVDGAIRSLPTHQNQAYMEAMEKCPDLVQTETDPLQFVRYCQYDIWAASKRLCEYWRERKVVFGPERAFLPLVLTGNGALEKEDTLTLHAGYPALLPDTANGQKVILFDRRKWLPNSTPTQKLRCIFYLFKLLSQDSSSQVDGIRCLVVLSTPRSIDMQWDWYHRALSLSSNCFPIKLQRAHMCNIPHQKKQALISRVMSAGAQVMLHYYPTRLQMHVEREPAQVLEELIKEGFDAKGVPMIFGGKWKVEQWFKWCQEQQAQEAAMERQRSRGRSYYAGASARHVTGTAPVVQEVVSSGASTSSTINSSCSSECRSGRNSRKRARADIMSTTTTSFATAAAAQPAQQQQQERSGAAPTTAAASSPARRGTKRAILSPEEKVAKRRMADLLHSRRKRERKRQEVVFLKEESAKLIQEHRALKAENERLEHLLERAQEEVIEQEAEEEATTE